MGKRIRHGTSGVLFELVYNKRFMIGSQKSK